MGEDLLVFERGLWAGGLVHVAGVDEVGCGCLAGPVVAAAVILPPHFTSETIRDSKQLTAKQRDVLFPQIHAQAIAVGVGLIGSEEIDIINIFQAARKAMQVALHALSQRPEHVLVDGRAHVDTSIAQTVIPQGDARSLTIAAASIIAKVTRDRLMIEWQTRYPQFTFAEHKGYGTRRHIEELRQFGVTPLHRRSYAPVREVMADCTAEY